MPIDIALPLRWVARGDRPAAQAYRLTVAQVKQPGLYLCIGRWFVALGDTALML